MIAALHRTKLPFRAPSLGQGGTSAHPGRSPSRAGFALYLAVLVTTVLFFLALGAQDVGRLLAFAGREEALAVLAFHAADGGLERGLARLSVAPPPLALTYSVRLSPHRTCRVEVAAAPAGPAAPGRCDLLATATVLEGNHPLACRRLARRAVRPGAAGAAPDPGRFEEMP